MRLWLNQGFAGVYHALALIKSGLRDAVHLTASHADPLSIVQASADRFVVEPGGLDETGYLAWIRNQCGALEITHLWPQRRARAIVGAASSLRGVSLIGVGTVGALTTLENKAATYAALAGTGVPVPLHRLAQTAADLDEALGCVEATGEQPCIKPAVSTFGHGFRRVSAISDPLKRMLHNDTVNIGRQELLTMVAEVSGTPTFLVMPYLEGPEYSVDCLAGGGRLLRHVARRKHPVSRGQQLVTSPEIARICALVTERFVLDSIFNIQLREHRGELYLLEVNCRMSGGLAMACASGLNFPEWAVRLAGGEEPDTVPHPAYGAVVGQIESPVRVAA